MCGIAGALETARTSDAAELAERGRGMASCLRHRGPDDEGVWTDEAAGLLLAHRRLAVLDLSPAGHQPMVSSSQRFVLVYNGEIYNFAELRRSLEDRGQRLRSTTDTEVLLELIALHGVAATLQRCRGMFALAVYDRQRRTLVLARDRFGEKPLYYGWSGSTFLFGSECSALRAHPDFDDTLDPGAVAALLRHSYIPAPLSIFTRVQKLLPGCTVEIRVDEPGAVSGPVPYWRLADVAEAGQQAPFDGSDEQAVDAVERVLRDAVREALVSDVPLGAFLSGGVDSSVVVALMQQHSSSPVRTYTVGFEEPEYDESGWGGAVAAHLGTDHTELRVTPQEAMAVVPDLPAMYDEPFADASQIPTALVSRLARRDVKVALSGDGGDELFGGYERYATADRRWRLVAPVPFPLRRVAAGAASRSPARRRLARMLQAERPESLYQVLLTHWLDAPSMVHAAPASAAGDATPPVALREPVTRFMLLDALRYLPDAVLAKVDRAAMATSLETRVPMLDPRVAEVAWSLPMHLRSGGPGRADKVALRSVLERHVPRTLTDRPKMGFGVPIRAWLRGPLRSWAEDLLSEESLRRPALLDPVPVRRAWDDLQAGRRDTAQELWNVLMLQAWLDAAARQESRCDVRASATPIDGGSGTS